ncbi:type III endosome membrane protein TEMP [Chanos chanos]|uniref:Type III endosome membrane protein TEMP n=1 Tax=Chanos chanos TaxID=29144 RepID=A0A6J2WU35_CHACN|nr:type III endosome membrane protein TEMP [Chanos chanos]XP_030647746.1 type III endosome membrane protein TEMP [Chanos chanos]
MGSIVHILGVILCFWGSGFGDTLHGVGPCAVSRSKASFDCSGRGLAAIPRHIWTNVTSLDLSGNHLNLTRPETLKELQDLRRLVALNLSGNYLPLLAIEHVDNLPSLEILDLRRCQLVTIQDGALRGLPNLKMLFLGNNHLQSPISAGSPDLEGVPFVDVHDNLAFPFASEGLEQNLVMHRSFHRKLLTTETPVTSTAANGTDDNQRRPSGSWKYLVAVLVTAITISILIAVLAKCKVIHDYVASYRHSRLSEADATSQGDPASLEVGFSTQRGQGRRSHMAMSPEEVEEDDDGFIEDNYIQASDRERAERAAEETEDADVEEEVFTIG